ncbi:DUF2156 domain-containing protein [Candidatus Woesebacteria bacterium]|nr:DUF2156 domain-containing protein [Candidatus Woesebacteria bacterium]
MDALPRFPQFKKLEITDKKHIESITHHFKAYSDFNFASLWNYDTENKLEWSILNDNLVVKFADYVTDELFLSFIGKNKIIDTIYELLDHADKQKLPVYLKLIPEEVIHLAKDIKEHFHVEEDPHNHDYILSIEEYLTFAGNKFASKRKNLRKFSELFPDAIVEMLDLSKESVQNEILSLFEEWSEMKEHTKDEVRHELKATERFMKHSNHFDHIFLGIRHNGKLISYSLLEKGHDRFLHNHFIKTLGDYKGLFEKIDHEMTKTAHAHGYSLVNIQQDLGLEGLKAAKSLGRPVSFLKKYIVKHKN